MVNNLVPESAPVDKENKHTNIKDKPVGKNTKEDEGEDTKEDNEDRTQTDEDTGRGCRWGNWFRLYLLQRTLNNEETL